MPVTFKRHPLLLCALLAGFSAGCVTEEIPVSKSRGIPLPPAQPLPPGPIGANANPAATISLRASAAIKPLGSIPYDGLTLPLVTPSGTLLLAAAGQMPAWDAVLAQPHAAPPTGTLIEAWQISANPAPGSPALSLVPWNPTATAGLLLGRSCTDQTVLVERPNADGTRSIGRLPLGPEGGEVQWFADETGHISGWGAILLRDGTLVYSTRPLDAPEADLVIRPPQGPGRLLHIAGKSLVWPLATPDQKAVGVFACGEAGEFIVISPTEAAADGTPRIITRQQFNAPVNETAAYQCAAPAEACPVILPDAVPGAADLNATLVFSHPLSHRIACVNARDNRVSVLPGVAAGGGRIGTPRLQGFLIAGQRSIDFFPLSALTRQVGPVAASPLVQGMYIARAVEPAQDGDYILLSPDPAAGIARLSVLKMRLVSPVPAGKPNP